MPNKNFYKLFILVITCFVYSSCQILPNYKPYYDKKHKDWQTKVPGDSSKITHTVFLIGDAGNPDKNRLEPTFRLLRSQLYSKIDTVKKEGENYTINYESDSNNTIIFLGDNIYQKGLPKEDASDRKEMERRLLEQLNLVKPFKGKKIFIPGNHDWGGDNGAPDGLETVIRQQKYVENYLGKGTFMPGNGCPGPREVHLQHNTVAVLIDSHWWLHKHEKPVGPENGCNVEDKFDFIVQLQDIIKRNKGKHIIICQHHPMFTNGNHGGYYTLKDYVFPLTLIWPNLYIPIPIIGAIYPLARKYGLSPQDLQNPQYQQLKKAILEVVENEYSVVFAAGHEHNLQLFKEDDVNHILSGAGCKDKHVAKGNDAIFAHNHRGFCKINYYNDGSAWVEFWEPEKDGSTGKLIFRTPLYALHKEKPKQLPADFDCRDSSIVLAASDKYKANGLKKTFFGEHYRKEWATPIKVRLLDMKCEAGSLTPIKKGGGQQTASLRLLGADSVNYTLRLINKDPASLLPKGFRETFAEEILQDQMSSAHPYGALIVPKMADAIGIYHLVPKLFYVPHTPVLGAYLDEMGGKMAFLEVRPDQDLSCFKHLGCSKTIISTRNMYSYLKEDHKSEVDQKMFLKARLFDMLIGDWDRHEDQWRWAEFPKEGGGSLYKPIPRDRDQVFVKYDGIIPFIISKYAVKNFSSFRANFDKVVKLGISAQNLDHTLLTKLTKQDWLTIADSIKLKMTDSIIEAAVKDLPPETFVISGPEIISKLKSRRAQLSNAALEYYLTISKTVDVLGSDKDEFFHVERINDKETKVSMYAITPQRKQGVRLYERTFYANETKEIRVHGLQGNDSILVTGNVSRGAKIRAVGGMGYDVFVDRSSVSKGRRKTLFYDTKKEKNLIVKGSETRTKEASRYFVNQYDVKDFKYNKISPKLSAEFNIDDGPFVGAGIRVERHGFRKDPYKSFNSLSGNYAFLTKAFNIKYKGVFYSVFAPRWDLDVTSRYFGPKFVFNYYGQGNETVLPDEEIYTADYFRMRVQRFEFTPSVNHRFSNYFTVGLAPNFEFMNIEQGLGKIIDEPEFPNKPELKPTYFGGAKFFTYINMVDNEKNPTRGGRWRNEVNYYHELKNGTTEFTNLNTDISFYITPNIPLKLTIGLRAGAAKNIGNYKFFQANFLGGSTNLRGYKRTRFAGRSTAFGNTEVRIQAYRFRNMAFSGTWGILGFADAGRVWQDNEASRKWHYGYGPGLWLNLYNQFLVSGYYGLSEESTRVTVKMGFFF